MTGFAGFDRYDYPGDEVMAWLPINTNLRWCGYYFGPLPNHGGNSWMTRRAALTQAGWGLAPIYVGRQLEAGSFSATPQQGSADGAGAAALLASEGFEAGCYAYLDIENGVPVSGAQLAYVQAWCAAVETAGFGAGIYCSHAIAPTVHNACPTARVWAFNVPTTLSHPVPFPCPDATPSGCGYVGAFAWQLGQNCRLSVPAAHQGLLDADLSTSLTPDPSAAGVADRRVAAWSSVQAMASMAARLDPPVPATVAAHCERVWPADKGDCSKFVRDVASACGVTLGGDADEITDTIRSGADGWTPLAGGVAAAASAAAGALVVGGLRSDQQASRGPHGHVVVVVPGPLDRGLYPTAYWGSLGGTPYENQTVNYAWVPADRDRVVYAAHALAPAAEAAAG